MLKIGSYDYTFIDSFALYYYETHDLVYHEFVVRYFSLLSMWYYP
jgi:hypothetical protein